MNNQKLSVIVPVYNVEAYLDKCVESIIEQTYDNLEIILVNDGSTDTCSLMCEEWEKKDERVVVIHKENGGLSSARNAGIDRATGEYIAFVDSDDWLERSIYEESISEMTSKDADVIIFGMTRIDEEGKVVNGQKLDYKLLEGVDIEKNIFEAIKDNYFGYAWNKVYKTDIIKNNRIKYNLQIIDREDIAFNLELLPYMKKVIILDKIGYFYLQRKTSLLHIQSLKRLEGMENFCDFMSNICIQDASIKSRIYNHCVKHYVADCIIKDLLWNTAINQIEKRKKMNDIFSNERIRGKLTSNSDEPLYLRALYRSFIKKNYKSFYTFFLLSELKKKIFNWIGIKDSVK